MASSFTPADSTNKPSSEINITPLIDIMLVLVVIFIITAPIATHKIRIDLPQPNQNVKPPQNPPKPLKLVIQANGALYLNDAPVTLQGLDLQLQVYAAKPIAQQPEVQINANDNVEYKTVAKVLYTTKNAGMQKIGFVNSN